MARTLSPAARSIIAVIAIAGLTLIAERAPAKPPVQRRTTPTTEKSSITIKPVAPASKKKLSAAPTTTAQGPRSTRPATTNYRNPFSADSTSPAADSTLLPGPRSRWRKAQAPHHEPAPARSAPQTIASPAIAASPPITPTAPLSEPVKSSLQLIEPKLASAPDSAGGRTSIAVSPIIEPPAEPGADGPTPGRPHSSENATREPLVVTGVETRSASPSALAPPTPPTPISPPRSTMSVRSAILTADTSEQAEFDWNNPPALKILPDNGLATASRANNWQSDEPSALELPDPTHFTPQPKEPIWLEAAAPQKQPVSPVNQAAFEEPLPREPRHASINAELPSDEPVESSGDEEQHIISDYADSPDGWLAQAKEAVHSAQSLSELSDAIELCQRVIIASPTPELGTSARRLAAWAHNRRGELLIDSGRTEEALKEFQAAVNSDAENSLAIHNRAVTLAQQSDFDAALVDFNRVIELNPGLAIAYRNRAELFAAQGKMVEAVTDYTQAIDSISDDAEIYRARAHALQQLGRFDQALADLDRSVRLAPNEAQGFTQRGNLLADRGEFAGALNDFNQSLAIDPKLAETHRGLAWLKATCPNDRYRDAYEALGAAQTAVKLSSPDDYLALDALAAAHANAGEFSKSIETLRQAINNAPPDAVEPMQARLNLYERQKPYRAGQ